MASSLAPTPALKGCPATLESVASFRVKTAALMRPAGPQRADPSMVLMTNADGGVVVYPPERKLIILARAGPARMRPISIHGGGLAAAEQRARSSVLHRGARGLTMKRIAHLVIRGSRPRRVRPAASPPPAAPPDTPARHPRQLMRTRSRRKAGARCGSA